jgi:cell division protein FtsW (lipid II flippase)
MISAILVTLKKKVNHFPTFMKFIAYLFLPLILFFIYIHDIGTLMTILFSATMVLLISEVKYKYVFVPIFFILAFLLPILYNFVPYVHDRLEVYINPETADLHSDYYQLNQMIITTGSGEIYGRGFGGSLQKFSGLLPEPLGDSIFSVYSEEFGFIGSTFLILLFLALFFFILSAAKKITGRFEKMVIVGLGSTIIFPAFYNIAASLGVLPLSGMPITFISKGGTAIFSALSFLAIILVLSKKR